LFGHEKVKILNGGRDKWKAEGRPMTRETPKYAETNYPVSKKRFDKEIRAFFDEALVQSKNGKPLIDVRSPGEYRGEITHMPEYPQEGVLRGGHIPGAKSMPWKTATNDDATFKPASELAKIYFEQCGVSPTKKQCLLPNRRALQSHLVCADLFVRPEQRSQLRRFVDGMGQQSRRAD
jgi:thiosulfate/3-mercaptopyruvate sulfurtransferase